MNRASGETPNASIAGWLVDTATKCFGRRLLAELADHPVARRLRIGQRLECREGLRADHEQRAAQDRPARAYRPARRRRRWRRSAAASLRLRYRASASDAMTMPRSDPPMPMLTTSVKRAPVNPVIRPSCTPVTKSRSLRELRLHRRHDVDAVRQHRAPDQLRSAMCSAGRDSVELTCSPPNRAARRSSSSHAPASAQSAVTTRASRAGARSRTADRASRRSASHERPGSSRKQVANVPPAEFGGKSLQVLPLGQVRALAHGHPP